MNEKQKLAIRAMYNEGRNVNQIAAIYMVSVAQVNAILDENIVVKPTKSKKASLDENL
jgi:DNA-directed RNA polymerase specialized sigma subunit